MKISMMSIKVYDQGEAFLIHANTSGWHHLSLSLLIDYYRTTQPIHILGSTTKFVEPKTFALESIGIIMHQALMFDRLRNLPWLLVAITIYFKESSRFGNNVE